MSNLCVLSSTATRYEFRLAAVGSPPPRKQKEIKDSQIGKEDVKYSLFIENFAKQKVLKRQTNGFKRIW